MKDVNEQVGRNLTEAQGWFADSENRAVAAEAAVNAATELRHGPDCLLVAYWYWCTRTRSPVAASFSLAAETNVSDALKYGPLPG
jgi:hypothetical protein